jgi:hypothetical protein
MSLLNLLVSSDTCNLGTVVNKPFTCVCEAGEASLLLALDNSFLVSESLDLEGISVGVSDCVSDGGVSTSGEKALFVALTAAIALGGREGRDLSS